MLVRLRPDLLSGALFVLLGAGFALSARHLPFGTTARMGPGYFPMVLSLLLIAIGAVLVLKGLTAEEAVETRLATRGLPFLLAAPLAFGLALEPLGFLPAVVLAAFLSTLAGNRFRLVPALWTTIVLTALCWGVFVRGLGLQLPILGTWSGG